MRLKLRLFDATLKLSRHHVYENTMLSTHLHSVVRSHR